MDLTKKSIKYTDVIIVGEKYITVKEFVNACTCVILYKCE